MALSAEFFKWMSMVSPTRTRMKDPGTFPSKVRIGQVLVERLFSPGDVCLLHGWRVIVPGRGPSLAAVDTCECLDWLQPQLCTPDCF